MKILQVRRKHTRGLLKLVFQLPEPGWKLCGMYYTQNSEASTSPDFTTAVTIMLSPYGTYGKSLYFSRRGTEKKAVLQGKNGEHPHANIRIIRIFFREDELVRHPCPEALQEQGTAAKEPERISSL